MGSPPAFGALGAMFTAMRLLQAVSLISIIGLTGNFVAELVSSSFSTPSALVGTLVVACLAMAYIVISYILYWDHMLPLLIATAADGLCFVASIVVACVLGRPVSYLNCNAFPKKGNTGNFIYSLFANVKHSSSDTFRWVDPSKASCYEIKAIWGLSIATSILFFMSAVAAICLWKRIKGGADRPRKAMDFE
ncbi:membrane-associating domain-containing [Trichoderma arundinaceum]|uniref:Membrane-associating domain-containing n=1 Tax=Trichoderma arundinaceum TaxID=490622 RepID=A0A395ND13_TRIAR|nr:membrane-associating domain-containing [Trichoderma arundinaceum]